MARPQLSPPCVGWQRDLPGPNDSPNDLPMLLWQAPTHMDETYVEFARSTSIFRGTLLFFSLLIAWTCLEQTILITRNLRAITTTVWGLLK